MLRRTWIEYDRSRLVLEILVSGRAIVYTCINYQESLLITNHPEWAVHIWPKRDQKSFEITSHVSIVGWLTLTTGWEWMTFARVFKRKVPAYSSQVQYNITGFTRLSELIHLHIIKRLPTLTTIIAAFMRHYWITLLDVASSMMMKLGVLLSWIPS